MKLKTILLACIKEIDRMYDIIMEDTPCELGETVAEEVTCIDSVLWDYINHYFKENIEIEYLKELEILPEYREKESSLINELLYYIYLYAYFIYQRKDRLIEQYSHLAYNLFWQIWFMIYHNTDFNDDFYGCILWDNGCDYLFNRCGPFGPNELKWLMFTDEGHKEIINSRRSLF